MLQLFVNFFEQQYPWTSILTQFSHDLILGIYNVKWKYNMPPKTVFTAQLFILMFILAANTYFYNTYNYERLLKRLNL